MISRRSLFLGSAAVILTPQLLMPVRPLRAFLPFPRVTFIQGQPQTFDLRQYLVGFDQTAHGLQILGDLPDGVTFSRGILRYDGAGIRASRDVTWVFS